MEIDFGWVDYSTQEQRDVLKTLDDLNEDAVDALGLSVISDYYAKKFFPGISTEQTRARYFVLVPYVFQDLKKNSEEELKQKEKEWAWNLKEKWEEVWGEKKESGIIGVRAMGYWKKRSEWVEDGVVLAQRAPSARYWTGLKKFGILEQDCSIKELLQKQSEEKSNDGIGKQDGDDFSTSDDLGLWNEKIDGLYKKNEKNYSIFPTRDEATFLKEQICRNAKGSLLAALLKRNKQLGGFKELGEIIKTDFKEFRTDFEKAVRFSKFAELLNAYYIDIISNHKSQKAQDILNVNGKNKIIDGFNPNDYKDIPNSPLTFLNNCKKCLRSKNEIEKVIKEREIFLKGKRAKTSNPKDEYNKKAISAPDFRYGRAKVIINDILKGLKNGK